MDSKEIINTQRLLVFAPHPDDESLATGVLIIKALAAGNDVRVIFATDGNLLLFKQRILAPKIATREAYGTIRRNEAKKALEILGVPDYNGRYWGYPDGGLHQISRAELVAKVQDAIEAYQPTYVVFPSVLDTHSDHIELGETVVDALSEYPDLSATSYLVDYPPAKTLKNVKSFRIKGSKEDLERKLDAIHAHKTQLVFWHNPATSWKPQIECFYPYERPYN